jgi:hypothetical protein
MNPTGALEAPQFAIVHGIDLDRLGFWHHQQKAGDNRCSRRRDICAAVWLASVR